MNFEEFLDKEIIIKQIKSGSKFKANQKGCLVGLGLRGIGSSTKIKASNEVIGMIKKISHVLKVSLA